MRFLIILIFLIFNSFAIEASDIKNLVINKDLKKYEDLNIKNLKIYFDSPITLAKKFGLRGIPTSILFNKDGLEFARIIGSIDFNDQKFIDWLANYN